MRLDDDDPDLLTACIAAITLKAHPQGLLADWLADASVPIAIVPSEPNSPRKGQPWLDVSLLEELPWAGEIHEAVLRSDHLEGSSGLYQLTKAERLTIAILGDDYHDSDLEAFQNAIQNLGMLKELRLVVSEAALGHAKDRLIWPGHALTCEIVPASRHSKAKRKEVSP